MSYSGLDSQISKLFDKLATIGNEELTDMLDDLLSKIYGLIILFLGDELTPQQRQIWLTLANQYPKPCSGAELAREIGSSQVSKTIYKSIDELVARDLVSTHQLGQVKANQANAEHPLSAALIDLSKYYGSFTSGIPNKSQKID
ncbi:MAG: hypothetical protein ACXAEU_19495 [Candidatus Hodarchaeales archaeon]|jgi:hypothetical protein